MPLAPCLVVKSPLLARLSMGIRIARQRDSDQKDTLGPQMLYELPVAY